MGIVISIELRAGAASTFSDAVQDVSGLVRNFRRRE
jgi:hypothetical protein